MQNLQHLQELQNSDSLPPSMRPKGKRQRVYQSISSAFSRLSSPILTHSLIIFPSAGTTTHLPEASTPDHHSHSPSPARKRQRLYQSLSSVFSRCTSSRAYSPETFSEAISGDDNDMVVIEAEGNMQSIEQAAPEALEDVEDEGDSAQIPRYEPAITNKNFPAQPQSESDASNGSSRAADTIMGAARGTFNPPPTMEEVLSAHTDLQRILKPPRCTGRGYKDPELDKLFQQRLEGMKQFMWTYINPKSGYTGQWQAASLKTADNLEKGPALAKNLRTWTRAFIADREDLLVNPYGAWNESVIDKHPEIAQEIHAHLQSIGKFVKAMDLVNFMDTPEM